MSLSAAEVGLVVDAIALGWAGAQVQKVHMRGPSVVMLTLRKPGRTGVLTLSVEPSRSFLCVQEERGPVDREASGFCMLLRRLAKGGRLREIKQLQGDRLVEVRCSRGSFVAEMIGRRGCFVALDDEGAAAALSSAAPPRKELAAGQPYLLPEILGRPSPPPRFEAALANEAACALFQGAEEGLGSDVDGRRIEVLAALKARRAKLRRTISRVQKDLRSAEGAEGLLEQGELLKLNIGALRRGMSSVAVEDILYGGGTVEITLDPRLGPADNLAKIFKKARKAKAARAILGERLLELNRQLEELDELRAAAQDGEAIEAVAAEAGLALSLHQGIQKCANKNKQLRLPYRRYLDGKGRPILVGRSARDNDSLTLQIARPTDLWLHARGFVGSHVVVPLNRDEQVDADRLVDAATMAAHFSAGRNEATVEVTYTHRRYVRKAKGAPAGQVTLLREKVFLLQMEPERLARLLRRRAG